MSRSDPVFHWFPGHMAKAIRALKADLKLADLLLLVCDARMPRASLPSNIEDISAEKKVLFVFNKADLAEEEATARWISRFEKESRPAVPLSAAKKKGIGLLNKAISELKAAVMARRRERGLKNESLRLLVAGIPNVGKSTLTNLLAGGGRALTGRKPGVTRGKQWLHTELGLDVLDTPGILPPKINSPEAGWLLAAAGCIPDDLFPMEEVASRLLGLLASRGRIPFRAEMSPSEILEKFGRERGFLMRGGIPDVKKTSLCVLRSFRDGKFGRLTLEEPGGSDPAKFKRSLTPGINE